MRAREEEEADACWRPVLLVWGGGGSAVPSSPWRCCKCIPELCLKTSPTWYHQSQVLASPSRYKETAECPVSRRGTPMCFEAETFPCSDLWNASCSCCTPAACPGTPSEQELHLSLGFPGTLGQEGAHMALPASQDLQRCVHLRGTDQTII